MIIDFSAFGFGSTPVAGSRWEVAGESYTDREWAGDI